MQTYDPGYLAAFARLLARPDPADLPRRGHVFRWQGDPNRRSTRLPGIQMAWLQRRHLDLYGDAPAPVVPGPRGRWSRVRARRKAGK